MPCGCANNKNLDEKDLYNKNLNIHNKSLSLENMKNLSIDEIINLYRQGYTLEDIPIESMQTYGQACTSGTQATDINWSSVSQQGGRYLYKESAKAIKINPTSRCLDSISFYGVRRIASYSIYVEIRQDDGTGNKPLGNPGDSTGQLIQVLVPYNNIPTSFGSFTVDLALLLPSIGTYWVVLRSSDYSCANAATQRLELSYHYLNENRYIIYGYSDLYCSPAGCCWYGLNVDPIPLATIKLTYNPPVLSSISITPTSASIAPTGTQQLSVTCKDQNNNAMTCPTLTWVSSNTSVATVNSSGLVTGVSNGTANITASAGGVTSNQSMITVSQILTTITVIPNPATVSINATQVFTAKAIDSNGNPMSGVSLTWTSSNTNLATVNPTSGTTDSSGNTTTTLTAKSTIGTLTLSANGPGGKTGNAQVSITSPSQILNSIAISPTSATIMPGQTKQFIPTCRDTSNIIMTCPTLTWNNTNNAVGTIGAGLFTAIAEGTTSITATGGGKTSNIATVTVSTTPPPPAGGGGIAIAAVAAIAFAYLILKPKPKV